MRILLVDDDAFVRRKLRDLLERRPGWVVVAEAQNGRDAVATFDRHMPDVTVMDLRMPEMNGLEAARQLTRQHAGLPILLVTLYPSKQLEEEARKAGIKGICAKSEIHCLLEAVEALASGGTHFGFQPATA
jgi:two-component system, response regulator PdtaR